LKGSVDVNGSQGSCLSKLRLSHREVEDEVVRSSRGVKTGGHLAKQMRNPRLGVAPTDVDDPL
jgi:hypothetical protein